MTTDIKTLVSRLNPSSRRGLEQAASLCVTRTHYNVEVEHLLIKLLETPHSDLDCLLRFFDLDKGQVTDQLNRAMDRFDRGSSRTPALSPHILLLLEEGWKVASLELNLEQVRSAALLVALLENRTLRSLVLESCPALLHLPLPSLKERLGEILSNSSESDGVGRSAASPGVPGAHADSPTPHLDQYTLDLTARAREGKIDPIRGRDAEIRQIIDILGRRRQNNPILTGEAGVGKTAVAEGFARRLASGDVPEPLQNVSLRVLDIGLLQAGAGIKGEFEQRLKSVIAEVESSPTPVILFVDEAHNLIGAGARAGEGDAANLLKPALARGDLRTIAATTWSEYKQYFEKDPALARRFQVVQVREPDEESALEMLRGIASNLAKHHRVEILDQAIRDAVRLSRRYISGRYLPDKAISVLDTACARVALAQAAPPPQLEDAVRRIEANRLEAGILQRSPFPDEQQGQRLEELSGELQQLESLQERLQQRLDAERGLVEQLSAKVEEIRGKPQGREAGGELESQLEDLRCRLGEVQGEDPMVPYCVDSRCVATVVSGWTGIPLGRMFSDEIEAVLGLRQRLAERIVGQEQALDAICRRIRTSRADLDDPGKPAGVFLLVGPSGVGKTETALALADLLYGGESHLVSVNLSEYQEAHTVSGLKGAPPGYVGYGTGGVLTEAVRHTPYSVVLLDEADKAHPDVLELFYQVFDKGVLEDAEGVPVDFRNTLILMTCNTGSALLRDGPPQPDSKEASSLEERLRRRLQEHFKAAFLGRLVVAPFFPLTEDQLRRIVRLKLRAIQRRFQENRGALLSYDAALEPALAARCTDPDSGARTIDRLLTHSLLPGLSEVILRRMAHGRPLLEVHIAVSQGTKFAYEVRE